MVAVASTGGQTTENDQAGGHGSNIIIHNILQTGNFYTFTNLKIYLWRNLFEVSKFSFSLQKQSAIAYFHFKMHG